MDDYPDYVPQNYSKPPLRLLPPFLLLPLFISIAISSSKIQKSLTLLYSLVATGQIIYQLESFSNLPTELLTEIGINLVLVLICLFGILYQCCRFLIGSCCRDKEHERIYSTLFHPLHISHRQFAKIIKCKRAIKTLQAGERYALEKVTTVETLGLLLSGKLLVTQNSRPLHLITKYQFVDSPEYFGVSTNELFQVTITAVEESRILIWHRDKLRLSILKDDFLKEMFDNCVGRDVVRKLVQVSDTNTTETTIDSVNEPLVGGIVSSLRFFVKSGP